MEIITSVAEMRGWSAAERRRSRTIGFVPTMGALHRGHSELVARSVRADDRTVVSVFVNPTQFNDPDDFARYPRSWQDDVRAAEGSGAHAIFAPTTADMYPDGFATTIRPGPVADPMEGLHRPGHFDGVATVVVKLLNIVAPDRAYFGEKDFQQLAVVRSVVRDLGLDVAIIGVETVRDDDGLALSSRNTRLCEADRAAAAVLYRALTVGLDASRSGSSAGEVRRLVVAELGTEPRCRLEYAEVVDARTLAPLPDAAPTSRPHTGPSVVICVAAWFGEVRLIDNFVLST